MNRERDDKFFFIMNREMKTKIDLSQFNSISLKKKITVKMNLRYVPKGPTCTLQYFSFK